MKRARFVGVVLRPKRVQVGRGKYPTCAPVDYVDLTRRDGDGRPTGLVPCATPWERQHAVHDEEGLLIPNCFRSRDGRILPAPHSSPRYYPLCHLTAPDPAGRGGRRSFDEVYYETEMRMRRIEGLDERGHVSASGWERGSDRVYEAMGRPGAREASRQRTVVVMDRRERTEAVAHAARVREFIQNGK